MFNLHSLTLFNVCFLLLPGTRKIRQVKKVWFFKERNFDQVMICF
jgi:hypothetical protein